MAQLSAEASTPGSAPAAPQTCVSRPWPETIRRRAGHRRVVDSWRRFARNSYAMTIGEGRTDVLQGTLDLMVLKTLAVMGPQHGYGIARRIEQISDDMLQLNEGTVRCSWPGAI